MNDLPNNVDLSAFDTTLRSGASEAQATPDIKDLASEADTWLIPLFNPCKPGYLLKRERPEHRIIVMLKCQGMSYREIAAKIGWSAAGVSNVCRQPWAQDVILTYLTRQGLQAVELLLSSETINNINKLIEIRDADTSPIAEQAKAANSLLDRTYGKPNQPITHREESAESVPDAELARIMRSGQSN